MTAKMLLEQYMAERHALGFVSKTDEGCIRRFLRDYKEPEDGKIVFSKCAISGPIYLLTLKLKRCWILQTIFLYACKTR